ncbi:hypothetical protein AAFF_G00064180 [Aldrovandia affinis]|uniref:Uncharacterized protein n=1 Tax=Aldrovandia affinis TaxID=143900 RepID=A0AAD7WYM9_9TELE|nr:hypothetical protein AAFF_G00064180 [Aldrovandia affinis]
MRVPPLSSGGRLLRQYRAQASRQQQQLRGAHYTCVLRRVTTPNPVTPHQADGWVSLARSQPAPSKRPFLPPPRSLRPLCSQSHLELQQQYLFDNYSVVHLYTVLMF